MVERVPLLIWGGSLDITFTVPLMTIEELQDFANKLTNLQKRESFPESFWF